MPPGIASARMSSDYSVLDQYIYKTRCLRVVIVGAGLTGIAAVHKLDTKFKDLDITYQIYEKNHDVGGTWLENRYPGCACDVPAHSVRPHLLPLIP
jgi:cation diffusion facilitator CzcD-associated flavoprotein CzcO